MIANTILAGKQMRGLVEDVGDSVTVADRKANNAAQDVESSEE